MTAVLQFEALRAAGLGAGLDVVGACSAEPFDRTREVLEERRAAGLNGSMQFTYRNPARSSDPHRTLPDARTLVVGACSYQRDPPPVPDGAGPVGRVARYVWADDHERLLRGLDAVAELLRGRGHRAVVLADQNNLVDRAVAHRAGLGWFGKNANLLLPGRGSWYVLGAVLTDAGADAVDGLPDPVPVPDGCGTCERCRRGRSVVCSSYCVPACPTGAIVAPGVVDARRCLSWSLQVTGPCPRDHREAVGDRIYGCDDCQEVCPPNRREVRRAAPEGRGHAVPAGDPDRAWVPLLAMLDADDDALLARYGRWYVPQRDPRYLRRNALVVLGNVGDPADPAVRAVVARFLAHEDPLLRAHAVWCAKRLGCDDLWPALAADPDPDVRAEVAAPVAVRPPSPAPDPRAP